MHLFSHSFSYFASNLLAFLMTFSLFFAWSRKKLLASSQSFCTVLSQHNDLANHVKIKWDSRLAKWSGPSVSSPMRTRMSFIPNGFVLKLLYFIRKSVFFCSRVLGTSACQCATRRGAYQSCAGVCSLYKKQIQIKNKNLNVPFRCCHDNGPSGSFVAEIPSCTRNTISV